MTTIQTAPAGEASRPKLSSAHERLALAGILALSAALNLARLNRVGTNGFGNTHYAAGVQSMLTSWRNFLCVAFDPAGFLAMDKAPLSLWLQAASARLFGFHGLSLLLPHAMAGVLPVYVLYRVVRRSRGAGAGLLATLALTLTPISVVTNRSNLPDALLVLVLLLAAGAVQRSVEGGSLRWLLAGAALVGVAFNVKMLQIVLVVPALAAVHMLCSPHPWKRRLWHGALALAVGVAVPAPWILLVELTPAELRPYVGGSNTNSVVALAFQYNGLDRLWAQDFSAFLGRPSPLRVFNEQLGGQVSWLLSPALVGLAAAGWFVWRGEPLTQADPGQKASRRAGLVLWATWLGTCLVYSSISTFFHRYYLSTMAPTVAALAGIGVAAVASTWRSSGSRRWWASAALVATAGVQILFLDREPAWGRWLIPLVAVPCLAAAMVLAWPRRRWVALACGVGALFVAPAAWATIPVVTCTHTTLPIGGPQDRTCPPAERKPFLDPELVRYLEAGREGAQYLAATYEMGIASLGILETGEPILALGGYRGSDPILTVDEFISLVEAGEVRYFLSLEAGGERWPQQEAILTWVAEHCPVAPIRSPGVDTRGPCIAGP